MAAKVGTGKWAKDTTEIVLIEILTWRGKRSLAGGGSSHAIDETEVDAEQGRGHSRPSNVLSIVFQYAENRGINALSLVAT